LNPEQWVLERVLHPFCRKRRQQQQQTGA